VGLGTLRVWLVGDLEVLAGFRVPSVEDGSDLRVRLLREAVELQVLAALDGIPRGPAPNANRRPAQPTSRSADSV
jgi:hypothetical protein